MTPDQRADFWSRVCNTLEQTGASRPDDRPAILRGVAGGHAVTIGQGGIKLYPSESLAGIPLAIVGTFPPFAPRLVEIVHAANERLRALHDAYTDPSRPVVRFAQEPARHDPSLALQAFFDYAADVADLNAPAYVGRPADLFEAAIEAAIEALRLGTLPALTPDDATRIAAVLDRLDGAPVRDGDVARMLRDAGARCAMGEPKE